MGLVFRLWFFQLLVGSLNIEECQNIYFLIWSLTVIFFSWKEKKCQSFEKNGKNYNLDIFQIKSGSSTSWDFEGQQINTLNLKSDRSFNPDGFKYPILVKSSEIHTYLKVAYNASQLIVFVSDNTSHNIPEVRAGPLAWEKYIQFNLLLNSSREFSFLN